ncbi:MAG: CBS domain-containing protein [Azoarcus sp.]|nr:CBS domain-containing protein [Azoarcus sp.]
MPTRKIAEVVKGQSIVTADRTLSVLEASQRMAAAHVGAIMVLEQDQLIGLFTERDALVRVLAAGLDPSSTPLAEVMTSNLQTIEADRPLGHAMHLMFEGGFRHVPVVDNGRAVGMVSARDALGMEMVAFEEELEKRASIAEIL